jgi:trehalose 6-phosphate synthase
LVTALRPVLKGSGCWIGWTGGEEEPGIADLLRDYGQSSDCSLVPVFLTAAEKADFYQGCCNQIIWPLFHDLQSRCNFNPAFWDVYREVSEKFADAVEGVAHKDDFVWVQDYHLMMLADALRGRESRLKLHYFHHIPFPPPDIFEHLPWRKEILRGLLQFSSLGFQTARDRKNFVASVRRCLREVHVQNLGEMLLVRAEGLCAGAGVFPISIDYAEFAAQAASAEIAARAEEIRRSLAPSQIVLGVDRLDYTKGILERLLAFRLLLRDYPEVHGLVAMAQVVVPSRAEVPHYRELKLAIERLVSEINGEYGRPGWVPVHYYYRCLSRAELVAFYVAADIALVTPLKDGMNLVAKEFCASRLNEDGVLVLSEFAGAASQLRCGALLVNPCDTRAVASALYRAFRMSGREQHVRMWRMRHHLRRHDVFRWRDSFCAQTWASYPRVPVRLIPRAGEPLHMDPQAIA